PLGHQHIAGADAALGHPNDDTDGKALLGLRDDRPWVTGHGTTPQRCARSSAVISACEGEAALSSPRLSASCARLMIRASASSARRRVSTFAFSGDGLPQRLPLSPHLRSTTSACRKAATKFPSWTAVWAGMGSLS